MTLFVLLIGVAYSNTSYPLDGTDRDAVRLQSYLKSRATVMVRMADHGRRKSDPLYPTSAHIFSQIRSLIARMQSEDRLYVHFSGHAFAFVNLPTLSNDYPTECIHVRLDTDTPSSNPISSGNTICQNTLTNILNTAPVDSHVFVTIDACSSGTMFDLEYNYQWKRGALKERVVPSRARTANIVILTSTHTEPYAYEMKDKNGLAVGTFCHYMMGILTRNRYIRYKDLIRQIQIKFFSNERMQDPQLAVTAPELIESYCII